MIALSVLGPCELRRDGVLLPVPAGKTTELLIRLALDAGVPVRIERLIDDLWGPDEVLTQRNTMQTKISKLRRALGDASLVTSSSAGYALAVDRGAVDAFVAVELAELASARLADGDPATVVDICGQALVLFRGDAVLPDAGERDWMVPNRARLDEVRLGLTEDQLEARLQLGAGHEVIGELEGLVVRYPLRERLWELLVTALYRAGRQADALATYQRVRTLLAEELGLDPGPRLQRLEAQILAQDAALGTPRRPVGTSALDAPAGNLPSMSVDLVGREGELAALSDLVAVERLVEIVGPGGVGKTAVVVEVGRRLTQAAGAVPGGVWLARLESASTDEDVIDVLIAAIGVAGGEAALFEWLRGIDAVVILDNCEHVVEAAAALAVRLLDAAPGVRVLCTSQVPLYVDGETVYDLAPLALPDAVQLFTRRAAANRPGNPSANDAVRDLCRALDGLPLAIELAAARTRTLSLEDISRRLDNRFAVLSDPTSRRPERRRSLRSTIRWSYDLLFPDDQRGLWALATFTDGAPLPAVEFVLEALGVPATAAIDVVGRLASRSLVTVATEAAATPVSPLPAGAAPASVRYQLLDSIRAFSLDAMTEARMAKPALAAHAIWFAAAADASTPGVRSSRQAEHLAFSRAERANIDAALAWSAEHDPGLGLRIVNGFGWSWVVLGDHRGAKRILAALDAAGDAAAAADRDRARALLLTAWLEASSGHLDVARAHISVATDLADAIGDPDMQALCCYYLAYVVSHHGGFEQAMELTDRSRALYDGLDRPWDQAANGLFAARAAISAGDRERSVELAARVEEWLQQVDDPWLHVRGEAMRGELARLEYRFDDAVLHIGQAAEASRRLGFQQTEAYQVSSLGRAQCQAGDYSGGAVTLQLAVQKAEATGDVRLAALVRVHLGRVLRALGQVEVARAALEAAAAWHRDTGGGEQAALGECLLAAMDAADRVAGAEKRLGAILSASRLSGDAPVEVFALDALGRIATDAGDIALAQDLHTKADRRMGAAAHFITDRDRTDAHWLTSMLEATPTG